MALTVGTQLGSYEITALLGKGGMGEVYRARDTKLDRSVAVKILPEAFAQNPDRIARFDREAKVLASLNHPNIATLHGKEESEGKHFLVMELVEGEALAERVKRGPIAIDEALRIACKITEALEAAHDKGVVHRDLKPANVMITPEDKVKVLDFGLAKAMVDAPESTPTLSNSPTLSLAATQAGVILGTAAYMAPEQAKGTEADSRSDVFSFGCVLYEMLTGRPAFHGESVSEILAAVLIREVDLSGLPADLNPRIPDLLRRCLQKNPKRRWQAIGDLRAELETIVSAPRSVAVPISSTIYSSAIWRRLLPVAIVALLIIVAGVTGWRLKPSAPALVTRFPLVLPEDQAFIRTPSHLIAISPDGTKLVYAASGKLFLRDMSQMQARPVQGASDNDPVRPFFSPDSQWIGFYSFRDSALEKVAIAGGATITICKTNGPTTAYWNGNEIVFHELGKGILRVPADGGQPEILVRLKREEGSAYHPQIVDGGRAVLFTLTPPGEQPRWDEAQIVVQSLASGERRVIVRGFDGHYVPSGHVIYAVAGTVFALPFDLKKLEATGGAVPMLDGVMRSPISGGAQLSVSDNGTLVYLPGDAVVRLPRRTLAFADHSGKTEMLPLPPAAYESPRMSPDGKQIAVTIFDGNETYVSIYALSGDTTLRRLTFGGENGSPVWSPDGKYVFFRSSRDGKEGIFRHLADGTGTPERLTIAEDPTGHQPTSIDPFGRTLVFVGGRRGDYDIFTLTLEGDRKPKPFVEVPGSLQAQAVFSPDGQWVAYMSNELQQLSQIYVQPYPTGAKYQITTEGGYAPVWSPDGKQLFYSGNNKLLAVDIRTQPTFSYGKPSPLPIVGMVRESASPRNYDITPDGKRFLVLQQPSPSDVNSRSSVQINVVLNWFRELQQRVPVK